MNGALTLQILALILFCIAAEMAREVCFKHAASGAADFLHSLLKPATSAGILLWGVELLAWMVVLEHVPLSIAFPLTALSYVAMVFAGALFFKEPVNFRHAVGACLITAGVICVGATGL